MKHSFLTGVFLLALKLTFAQPGLTETYLSDELKTYSSGRFPNILTLYVVPSTVEYDWSSPRALYKSYLKNYRRNLYKKDKYLLGHAFIELSSPLSDSLILTGMRAASRDEQRLLVMREKYGLAILGADLKGKLERGSDLDKKVEKYSRKGQLAFMTFLINDQAAARMLEFFSQFKQGTENGFKPEEHYGGAYWPRYHGEGAGCSAFAVSFLELGGLLLSEFREWLIQINIPMDLIGGPYNPGNEVSIKDVLKTDSWADGNGEGESGAVPFEIYDPTLIYDWISASSSRGQIGPWTHLVPVKINKARGILIDVRQEPVPAEEELFLERENGSIFVDGYPSGLRK